MKNRLMGVGSVLLMLCLCAPAAFAFSGSTVNITSDGSTIVSGAKVMQLAGASFYTRLYWGDSFVRLLVKTTSATKFLRGTGEMTTLAEVAPNDVLNLSGQLESGSESLVLVASTVTDASVQKEQVIVSGKVTAVDVSSGNFTLNSPKLGVITVATSAATVFTKGSRTLDLAHVKVGDTITKAAGDYNITTKTLTASSVLTYTDPNIYKPQNFQGTLQSVSGMSVPATLQIMIGNISYVVNVTANTAILNTNKNSILLSRFVPGDTVRVYGAIREVDDPIIDAQIVRNISL